MRPNGLDAPLSSVTYTIGGFVFLVFDFKLISLTFMSLCLTCRFRNAIEKFARAAHEKWQTRDNILSVRGYRQISGQKIW